MLPTSKKQIGMELNSISHPVAFLNVYAHQYISPPVFYKCHFIAILYYILLSCIWLHIVIIYFYLIFCIQCSDLLYR